MKIFCKFPTINISTYFWLVICFAKDLIWTTLKVIFSIFRFFVFAPSDSRLSNTLVNIWSGSKPFIKVVLKPKYVHVVGQPLQMLTTVVVSRPNIVLSQQINGKLIYSAFRWCINLSFTKLTRMTGFVLQGHIYAGDVRCLTTEGSHSVCGDIEF